MALNNQKIVLLVLSVCILKDVTGFPSFSEKKEEKVLKEQILPDELEDGEKIVGGENAKAGEAPYQVSLRTENNRHFCGGSIIGDRATSTSVFIVAGTNRLNAGGDKYEVEDVIVNKGFNFSVISDDIGLLKTSKKIVFNDLVQPIQLAKENTGIDEELVLTGWGTTTYPGTAPNKLQKIELKSISYDDCKEKLRQINQVFETQLCTLTRMGQGACHGDSGGPLVEDGYLVGIVSWGMPCAQGYPDVFTRVFSYLDWIKENQK